MDPQRAQGDFVDFVLDTYDPLFNSILRWVHDRPAAEDLTQTTYAAVLGAPEFDVSRPDAVGFLLRKARWLVKDYWRLTLRAAEPLPEAVADTGMGQPEQILDQAEDRA